MSIPTSNAWFAAKAWRVSGLVGMALLGAVVGRADDATFRAFPRQEAPSPGDLARLLSDLQIEPTDVIGEGQQMETFGPPLSPGVPPPSADATQRWAEGFLRELPVDGESRAAITAWLRTQRRASDGGGPAGRRRSSSVPGGARPRRNRPPQPGRRAARGDTVAEPQSPASPPRDRRTPGPSDLGEWLRLAESSGFTLPEDFQASSSGRRGNDAPRRQPSRPTSPRAAGLGDQWNRILLEAARRAGREAGRSSAAPFGARESFLSPLVVRVQELVAERGDDWQRQWTRSRSTDRGDARPSSRQRFTWGIAWPDGLSAVVASNPDPALGGAAWMAGAGGRLWLLAVPAVLGIGILLVAARNRKRANAGEFPGVSPRFAVPVPPITSPDGLVRAVDHFLLLRFGRVSRWWHCGAVERALVGLRPDLRGEIARLVADYQWSRYGPRSGGMAHPQWERSAHTLRQLAGPPAAGEPA